MAGSSHSCASLPRCWPAPTIMAGGRYLSRMPQGGLVRAALVGVGAYTFGNAVYNVTDPLGCAGLVIAIAAMVMVWRVARPQEKPLHAQMEGEALTEALPPIRPRVFQSAADAQ